MTCKMALIDETDKVERAIDPCLLKVLIPPFSLQPLVENAVQHGIHSSPRARRVRLLVRPVGGLLELSVSDDGQGVSQRQWKKFSFQNAPGHTHWCCYADGCKDCSGARFSWKCRVRLDRAPP